MVRYVAYRRNLPGWERWLRGGAAVALVGLGLFVGMRVAVRRPWPERLFSVHALMTAMSPS